MKNIFIFLLAWIITFQVSWTSFSEQNFHDSEAKIFVENVQKSDEMVQNKVEEKIEKNDYEKIFHNIPENKQKIIEDFLKKFEDKWYFSHMKKISYRKNSSNRWLASASKIYFDFEKIDTNEEFKRVMIHEMGHIFDLWFLVSKEKKIVSNFKDWTKKIYADNPSVEFYSLCFKNESEQNWKCSDVDFPSKYWQTNPFEDFAESFLLFIENNDSFKKMANESNVMMKKYNFLKKYFWDVKTWTYKWQENFQRVRDLTLAY